MSDKDKDVNNGEGVDNLIHDQDADVGSSTDDLETHNPDVDDYDEIIKLMDDDDDDSSGGTENADDSNSDDTDVDEGKDKDGDDDDEPKAVPYERFKEVNDKMRKYEEELSGERTARSKLEGRMELMEKMLEGKSDDPDTKEVTPLPLDDILSNENPQAILDAFQENPADFLKNYEQRITQLNKQRAEEENAEKEYYSTIHNALDEFGKENEDFHQNIDKLVGIVQEKPHHNVVSAYYETVTIPALKAELESSGKDIESKLEEAKKEGFKEGRKKTIEEIRAKGGASVLDGSSSSEGGDRGNPEVADLKNIKDRDELVSHLTQKLIKKRSAS